MANYEVEIKVTDRFLYDVEASSLEEAKKKWMEEHEKAIENNELFADDWDIDCDAREK